MKKSLKNTYNFYFLNESACYCRQATAVHGASVLWRLRHVRCWPAGGLCTADDRRSSVTVHTQRVNRAMPWPWCDGLHAVRLHVPHTPQTAATASR